MGPGAAAPAGVRGGAPAGSGAEPRRGAGQSPAKKISEIYRVSVWQKKHGRGHANPGIKSPSPWY